MNFILTLIIGLIFIAIGVFSAIYGPQDVKIKEGKLRRLGQIYFFLFGTGFALGGVIIIHTVLPMNWLIYALGSLPFFRLAFKHFLEHMLKDEAKDKFKSLEQLSDLAMLCSILVFALFFFAYPGPWALPLGLVLFGLSLGLDMLHYRLNR